LVGIFWRTGKSLDTAGIQVPECAACIVVVSVLTTLSWLHLVQEVAVNFISTYAPLRWSVERYTYVAGKMLIGGTQSQLIVVVCDSVLFWYAKHHSVTLRFAQ
jgi:hypothetical protein